MRDDSHVVPTVVIVDDHGPFRAAARRMLESEGFRVLGEADDGASGIALARDTRPDLVLLDLVLPDQSGFDVAEALSGGSSKVVLVSSRGPGDVGRRRLRESSAVGFVGKDRLSGRRLRELLEPSA
jgi:DNA-binding NarL/FixJ family response regulator